MSVHCLSCGAPTEATLEAVDKWFVKLTCTQAGCFHEWLEPRK